MKKMLPAFIRHLVLSAFLLTLGFNSWASHIVGGQLSYQWISCNTYQITMVLYGDCSSTSAAAFSSLPIATPEICIFNGATYQATLQLGTASPSCGTEVTPVCADSLAYDQCTIPTSLLPGIKKFVYTGTYTFPVNSAYWRLVYTGDNGNTNAAYGCTSGSGVPSASGRAAAITNLLDPGGAELQLIDTLNNSVTNTRGHNSNPELTVEPIPFFCATTESCYNPGAVDIYDVSSLGGEPSGDSLNFTLIPATEGNDGSGSAGACTPGGANPYAAFTYCPGGTTLLSGAHPLQVVDCTPASFSFDNTTGQLCFNPVVQRSVVVYNIDEYRKDSISDISTIAGTGLGIYGGDGLAATAAQISDPAGIRKDNHGNTYIADYGNNRIRKVNSSGTITTVAGTGAFGYCGDGGAATSAVLNRPVGIGIDTSGNVIFADNNNNVIRKINVSTGVLTTIAGNGIAGYAGDGGGALGTINTYAGTGVGAFSGDGAAATTADVQNPAGICQDAAGNTYFSDYSNNRIRMVNTAGVITTIAGNSSIAGYSGDGGPAIAAQLNNPEGMWIASNVLYFADYNNNVIRQINLSTYIINTVAGDGVAGFAGDGGSAPGTINTFAGDGTPGYSAGTTALTSEIQNPAGICKDAEGNIYFADYSNNCIRAVSITGTISTIAGTPGTAGYSGNNGPADSATMNNPQGMCISGNILYFADYNNNVVRQVNLTSGIISLVAGNGTVGFAGDGDNAGATTCKLDHPYSVFTDAANDIYISDAGNNRIRMVTAGTGIINTIAGNGTAGYSIPPTGTSATAAELNNPCGLYIDATGNVYVADAGNNRIRMISFPAGIPTISDYAGNGLPAYAGDEGPANEASFNYPTDVYMDAHQNLYVADNGNSCVRVVQPNLIVTTAMGIGGTAGYSGDGGSPRLATMANPSFVYCDPSNKIYVSDFGNNRVRIVSPCELNHPHSVFADAANNVYITDANNERIRKIDPFGTITTIAGNGIAGNVGTSGLASLPTVELNNPYGIFEDASGNIFFADAGNNQIRVITAAGSFGTPYGSGTAAFAGDGGGGATASFNTPTDVFEDLNGDLFIADRGNYCIRKISGCSGNIISTVAGRGGEPGFAGDGGAPDSAKLSTASFLYLNQSTLSAGSGNMYISDNANNRIRVVTPIELNHPTGVFVDQSNNVYISDTGNNRVRKITASTGIITTIAGNGIAGYSGDGMSAVSATSEVNKPEGLFVDNAGNVYIADANNNRIREITAATGVISTVVGDGTAGYAGDNCTATSASVELNGPSDVSVEANGSLFIADRLNNRIRKVDVTTGGVVSTVVGTGTAGFGGDGGAGYLGVVNSPDFLTIDTSKNVLISDYNNNRIRELAYNSAVNTVMVGSMQREMTFTVLTCSYTTPTGLIDSVANGTRLTPIDSTEVYTCQYTGNLLLYVNPREPADTSLNITITASGLNAGFSLGVNNDNTNAPTGIITVNTNVATPGRYTFYITYTDNHCPLVGTFTQPFTVDIYPVPSLKDSLLSAATCADSAAYLLTPGGYGTPWTIYVTNQGVFPIDTLQTFASDTGTFVDSLHPYPGYTYTYTIFTSVSNLCAQSINVTPVVPTNTIASSFVNPDYCGATDGVIYISGLSPDLNDSLFYSSTNTQYFHYRPSGSAFVSSSTGTDTIPGLLAGLYDTIVVEEGLCYDTVPYPTVLTNPPFTFSTVTSVSPTKCGYCNGIDTMYGLHPNQLDTLVYRFIAPGGAISHVSGSVLVDRDSLVVFNGLCGGTIDSFRVNTAGVCYDTTWPGSTLLIAPGDTDNFNYTIHYGCNGDTLMFNNLSTAAAGDMLYYTWNFGDGSTDNTTDPMHIYHNTTNDSLNITLTISNLKCVDSLTVPAVLNNYIHAAFTDSVQYICQGSSVLFTNLSTGVNPTYTWYYGDGDSDIIVNPVHQFTNSGTYTITLVAADNLLPTPTYFTPCYDTATLTLAVDSTSSIGIVTTDSVLCSGQAVTFTGEYTSIGNVGNAWTFGDGTSLTNVNPVQHSFDGEKSFVVTLTALFRVCASETTSDTIRVYSYPSIYLGPDTSLCPGSPPIVLIDNTNATNAKATWLWNTGDTTPSIVVTKPGDYSTAVTIDGCVSYDTVVVLKDCYMDIPNAFTPNGDGTNDYFYPRQLLTKGLTTFKMDIYNRWGQLIYETTSTDGRGWDGNFNGTPQPEGVYVYVIEATFRDGQIEQHQGNVTLLR